MYNSFVVYQKKRSVIKKYILVFTLVAVFPFLSACGFQGTRTFVTNTTNISSIDFTESVKEGKDCEGYLFGLIGPFGRSNLENAAKKANIKTVSYVDYSSHFYFFYGKRCLHAYGN